MTCLGSVATDQNAERLYVEVSELIDAMAAASEDRFPLFAPPATNAWRWSRRGSWLGGFWGAIWWLRARLGDGEATGYAEAIQHRLEPQLETDSVHRSLIFWYGAGPGSLWERHPASDILARDALAVLLANYSPRFCCFPLGTGLGAGSIGAQQISVDSLSSLVALVQRFGNRRALECLLNHIKTLRQHCAQGQGIYCAQGSLTDGAGETSAWARGQAWTMLGLVRAAEVWPEHFSREAEDACEGWWRSWGARIPFQRNSEGEALPDASAALMAGLAMRKGQHRLCWSTSWCTRANTLIATALRTSPSQPFLPAALTAPYTTAPGEIALVQTPWTLFFSLLTLAHLTGRLSLNDVLEVI